MFERSRICSFSVVLFDNFVIERKKHVNDSIFTLNALAGRYYYCSEESIFNFVRQATMYKCMETMLQLAANTEYQNPVQTGQSKSTKIWHAPSNTHTVSADF